MASKRLEGRYFPLKVAEEVQDSAADVIAIVDSIYDSPSMQPENARLGQAWAATCLSMHRVQSAVFPRAMRLDRPA